MATVHISPPSPPLVDDQQASIPRPPRVDNGSDGGGASDAYERYLRLRELTRLFTSRDFPDWASEAVVKPALMGLEITFRFISAAAADQRPYADRRQRLRRLESLAARQIELVAELCDGDDRPPVSTAPLPPTAILVRSAGELTDKILLHVEAQMRSCPFTLGLGEPNLAGKPILYYDLVVRPAELHALTPTLYSSKILNNPEEETVFSTHQILECWLFAAGRLLGRLQSKMESMQWEAAAGDCWILERIWKLLSEIEELHLAMDPDDFLRLKSRLAMKTTAACSDPLFCFRSKSLIDVTARSKNLKQSVPAVLGAEVDPNGGPALQEAAMRLYHSRRRCEEEGIPGRIRLLQAMQAVEAAVKGFYFGYQQLVMVVMGSAEASCHHCRRLTLTDEEEGMCSLSLSRMFMEPPYFPSLDAAKTFLGEYWNRESRRSSAGRRSGGSCVRV